MFVVFAQFAYFQRNDLDEFNTQLWYVWVVIYAACSIVSLTSYFIALPRRFYISFCLSSLAASLIRLGDLTSGQEVFMNKDNPAGNEAGGLMIMAIWFGLLAWKQKSLAMKRS